MKQRKQKTLINQLKKKNQALKSIEPKIFLCKILYDVYNIFVGNYKNILKILSQFPSSKMNIDFSINLK